METTTEPTLADLVAILRESNARVKVVAADFAHTLAALDVVTARLRSLRELTADALVVAESLDDPA